MAAVSGSIAILSAAVLPPEMPYLSKRALTGLRDYKYVAGGYTLLDDLHQPFWNWVVTLFPMWLAPNLITLLGTAWLLLAYCVSAYYTPNFEGNAPSWVYFLNGLAVLLYLHLDCLDGKQARRTKSSSPLGQLFDHGCDALAVHLIVSQVTGTLDAGPGNLACVGTLAIMIPWVAAQWEEYHTGLMLYGNGYYGITEANYVLVGLHWVTAAVGPQLWSMHAVDVLHLSKPAWLPLRIQQVALNEIATSIVVMIGTEQLIGQLWRVIANRGNALPVEERGAKLLGPQEALKQVAQFIFLFTLGGALMLQPMVAPGQIRADYATFGIIYALQATRLIVTHMAKEPFVLFCWPISLLLACLANHQLQFFNPVLFSWAAAGIALGGYLHYVFCCIDQICEFLGIRCLSIVNQDAIRAIRIDDKTNGVETDEKDE